MIPPFSTDGNLPPGVHTTDWAELEARYGWNPHRRRLLAGLSEALAQFSLAGCQRVYVDGSFITNEDFPNDYDVCYEMRGVDPMYLDPVFLDLRVGRLAQKTMYGGEFFPTSARAVVGYNFFQFFQTDKRTGASKGILALNLGKQP
jgi:hypothetical protein